MSELTAVLFGILAWFLVRYGVGGFYTIGPNERAVLTTFGRARRLEGQTTADNPNFSQLLDAEENLRYRFPVVRVTGPGFYWKFPWQRVRKVSVATNTVSIAYDPENAAANHGGTILEAVTKDQLNIGLTGQLRYAISERNLYAYLFGVKNPVAHVMGYFISVLRARIATFGGAVETTAAHASENDVEMPQISINELRKRLRDLNESMNLECAEAEARYGIAFDAALITGIDPPQEVEGALAAINTAHNHVSSEISVARAAADQKIVMSKRAVEIETLNAQAEVEPLLALANELHDLQQQGPGALRAYLRNIRLALFNKVDAVVMKHDLGGRP